MWYLVVLFLSTISLLGVFIIMYLRMRRKESFLGCVIVSIFSYLGVAFLLIGVRLKIDALTNRDMISLLLINLSITVLFIGLILYKKHFLLDKEIVYKTSKTKGDFSHQETVERLKNIALDLAKSTSESDLEKNENGMVLHNRSTQKSTLYGISTDEIQGLIDKVKGKKLTSIENGFVKRGELLCALIKSGKKPSSEEVSTIVTELIRISSSQKTE